MALNLSVPALAARLLAEVELRPAKVERWLAELPLLNVAETARKLYSTLCIYNRIAIDDHDRLALLELYRSPLKLIATELEKQYLGLPLPLAEKHKAAAEQNRQFCIEMAFGYKRLVLNAAQQPGAPVGKHLVDTTLAIQRAIRYLTEALAVSFEIYAPCPLGAWREIHALYRYAEQLGVTDTPLADPLNITLPHISVGHAYKQALLLDLSDPYHLPARLTGKIHHYLDRYAGLAVILPATQTFDPTCQFLIDPEEDCAGLLYVDATLELTGRFRLLNTIELARTIHRQLTALQAGQVPAGEGLEADFFQDSDQDLLRHLGRAWGVNPRRAFRRIRRSDAKVELAVGLEAINYWLNGGSRFVVSSTFVGPLPQRTLVGPNENKTLHIEAPELLFASWTIRDESASGLALEKHGYIKQQLRVGDLVAHRAPGAGNTWTIDVVRWVKSKSPSHIEIGVQRLAPHAQAVVVKTVSDKGKESDFMPAVLLPELPRLKQKATLVTHRGVWRPQRRIYLDNGARLMRVVIGEPVEITSAFECFQFEVEES